MLMKLFDKKERSFLMSWRRRRVLVPVVCLVAVLFMMRLRRKTDSFSIRYYPQRHRKPAPVPFNTHRTAHGKAKELCKNPQRLGDGYGGWTICEPAEGGLRGSLVYTVGIGRNIKWDEDMIRIFGTIHHGWDPTPSASDFFSKRPVPQGFTFHKFGLGVSDGIVPVKLPVGNNDSYTIMEYHAKAKDADKIIQIPVMSLETMMKTQGHTRLAILKIDIEGAEFDVISDWAARQYRPAANQILFEFHERYFTYNTTQGHISPTRLVPKAIEQMRSIGFEMLFRHHWEYTFVSRDGGVL